MNQKSVISIIFTVGLAWLIIGCQAPEQFDSLSVIDSSGTGSPRSVFIPHRKIIYASVGEPVLIESVHISQTSLLGTLEIAVNGQPIGGEQTAGLEAFPDKLATIRFLDRGRAGQTDYLGLEASSPICRSLIRTGGLIQANPQEPEFPSSTWTVCQIWMGRTPGTYDLTLRVTDRQGHEGNPIVQRIEVQ